MSLCWHYELLSRGRKNKRATPRRSDQQNAFEFRRSWIGKYSLFIFFGSVFFLPFVEPLKKRRPLKRLDQSSLKLKDRLRPGKKCVFFLRRLYVRTDLRKIRQLKNVLKNLHQLCPKLKDRLRNIFRNIRPFCWSVRWFIFFCRDFFISKRLVFKWIHYSFIENGYACMQQAPPLPFALVRNKRHVCGIKKNIESK